MPVDTSMYNTKPDTTSDSMKMAERIAKIRHNQSNWRPPQGDQHTAASRAAIDDGEPDMAAPGMDTSE